MARADAALMTSSNAPLVLLSHPPRLAKSSIESERALLDFDRSSHNLIDLAKIGVLACPIVIKGRRPP
jgi:hypothetical protein